MDSFFIFYVTNLNIWTPMTETVPLIAFYHRFSRSFFLALMNFINLFFIIILRRYWIEGFDGGFRRTLGYQFGQTRRLIIMAYGFKSIYRYKYHFFDMVGIIAYFLVQFLCEPILLRTIRQKRIGIYTNEFSVKNRLIFLRRFICSWLDYRILSSVFNNQTFEIQNFKRILFYFSYGPLVSITYGIGLFIGGILFSIYFRITILNLTIKLFRKYRFTDMWINKISTIIFCISISIIFSRFSIYGLEYFVFAGKRANFCDRDSGRNALLFRCQPDSSNSIVWERSNTLGTDTYGRSIPEILRDPWVLGRLSIEVDKDNIDQIQRTGLLSIRTHGSYLGNVEIVFAKWFYICLFGEKFARYIISTSGLLFPDDTTKDENKTLPINKIWEKFDWDDLENLPVPIRENIEDATLSKNLSINNIYIANDSVGYYKYEDEYEKNFRTVRILNRISELGRALFVTEEFTQKERLPGFDEDLLPTDIRQYTNLNEFSRKRKARNSFINSVPISTYVDALITSQIPITNFLRAISTRQQQRELCVAQNIIIDYISTVRNYLKNNNNLSNPFRTVQNQTNNIFNQQYVGNLQFVRRLFVTCWDNRINFITEVILLRRNLSLDQKILNKKTNIFEHEELRKSFGIQNETVFPTKKKIENNLINNQKLYSQKRYFPELQVDTKPLYLRWDSQTYCLCVLYENIFYK